MLLNLHYTGSQANLFCLFQFIHIAVYIYIYIYIERERERERIMAPSISKILGELMLFSMLLLVTSVFVKVLFDLLFDTIIYQVFHGRSEVSKGFF